MSDASFEAKTEMFEGPLELLLDLIEKRKLSINDINLAKVTDDFIEYVQKHMNFPVKEIAQFIVVASTLLLIKSRSLLPVLELTEEEEEDVSDLERRLKEYKRFKELSTYLRERFGQKIIFGRSGKLIEPVFSPSREISFQSILESIKSVISEFPMPEKLPAKTLKKVISLEETIENLLNRIKKGIKMSLKDFYSASEKKDSIIVSFLAVLELVKRGTVLASQENSFSEIEIVNS